MLACGNGYKCAKCEVEGNKENPLTVDHIVPVWVLQACKLHDSIYEDEENYQILCKGCNILKGSNCDSSNPKTKVLLRKYLINELH